MQKLYTILAASVGIFFLAIPATNVAQTSLTQAVDFTVTDINGNEHTLFDYLSAGKYVCLDFLFTTCGPCQANQSYFTEAYHNYGCNGGDVIFLSLETTVGDAETAAYEEEFAGENPPPMASCTDGGACEAESPYGISAFPTFILIAPDGSIVEQDIWPLSNGAETYSEYFDQYGLEQMECTNAVTDVAMYAAGIKAFPMPANESLQLEVRGLSGTLDLSVYDLLGRKVKQAELADASITLSTFSWKPGWYVVEVTNGLTTIRQRVSIVH